MSVLTTIITLCAIAFVIGLMIIVDGLIKSTTYLLSHMESLEAEILENKTLNFNKLDLTKNSILVIKSDYISREQINKIRINLNAQSSRNVLILGISTEVTLETIEIETAKKILKQIAYGEKFVEGEK